MGLPLHVRAMPSSCAASAQSADASDCAAAAVPLLSVVTAHASCAHDRGAVNSAARRMAGLLSAVMGRPPMTCRQLSGSRLCGVVPADARRVTLPGSCCHWALSLGETFPGTAVVISSPAWSPWSACWVVSGSSAANNDGLAASGGGVQRSHSAGACCCRRDCA